MRSLKHALTTAALGLLACFPCTATETLIIGIGADQGPPLIIREQNQPKSGIFIELMNEMGRRLKMEVRYISLPKKRQEPALLSGQIHLFALTNPLWFQYSDQYRWSAPMIQDQDIFILNRAHLFPLQRFSDLIGKRLGTIRGFHYEGLMDYFESGQVVRDDAANLQQNFDKLSAGRVDALIGSKILSAYLLSQRDDGDQLQMAAMVASSHSRRVAFSPYFPADISDAYFELQQIQLDGTLEKILERYR